MSKTKARRLDLALEIGQTKSHRGFIIYPIYLSVEHAIEKIAIHALFHAMFVRNVDFFFIFGGGLEG